MAKIKMSSLPVGTKISVGGIFEYKITDQGEMYTKYDVRFAGVSIGDSKIERHKEFDFEDAGISVTYPEGKEPLEDDGITIVPDGHEGFDSGIELVGATLRCRETGIHYLVLAASDDLVVTLRGSEKIEDLNDKYMLVAGVQ